MPREGAVTELFPLFVANVLTRAGELGLSQADLARKLEMAPTQLSRLLRGGSSPTLAMIERFARALSVSPSSLLCTPDELKARGHDIEECVRRVTAAALKRCPPEGKNGDGSEHKGK